MVGVGQQRRARVSSQQPRLPDTVYGSFMTDLFVALISTTDLVLREPKPLRLR
jgi:hypothetical protein